MTSEDYERDGYILIRGCLSKYQCNILKNEIDILRSSVTLLNEEDDAYEKGCVFDIFEKVRVKDKTRVSKDAYLEQRFSKDLISVDADHREVIAHILFNQLPNIVSRLLHKKDDNQSLQSTKADDDDDDDDDGKNVYLFNEHYVVKPSKSSIEFRWHRDEDEQLNMCLFRNQPALPYLSCWVALDNATAENGCIRLVPFSENDSNDNYDNESSSSSSLKHDDDNVDKLKRDERMIEISQGSVLIFSSRLWHSSGPNLSNHLRRAFYCQYSKSIIQASHKDQSPLSFAIPCTITSSDDTTDNKRKRNENENENENAKQSLKQEKQEDNKKKQKVKK